MGSLELSAEVVSMLQEQNNFLFEHFTKLRKENLKMHQLLKKHKWGHKLVEHDDKQVEYLTGCSTYKAFLWLMTSVVPEAALQHRLSPANQLMLTLMKVKLCIPDIYLEKLFHENNAAEVCQIWLNALNEHMADLLVWPKKKEKTADYSVTYLKVQGLLQVAVVFTAAGSICYVSEAHPSSTAWLEQDDFLRNIDSGDRIIDLQSSIIYSALNYSGRMRFNRTSKTSNDFLTLSASRKVIATSVEKLKSFAVFSRDTREFSDTTALVKLSAALVNL